MASTVFVPPPNVGPEPPGLLAAIKSKIFGQTAPEPEPGMPNPGTGPADPYDLTDKQLLDLLTDVKKSCEPGRELFEYGWWRNLLYLLGRQWIYWHPTSRQWNDKRLAKWVPKPVTNIIRTAVLSVRSVCASIATGCAVRPNGNDPKNVMTASTADDLEPALADEHHMDDVMTDADYWAAVLGNAYLHPHWDPSDMTHTTQVDAWACQVCQQPSSPDQINAAAGNCPNCNASGENLTLNGTMAVPIGKGKTIVVSPLELMLPLYAAKWEDVDRLIYMTWRPKHQLEDEYGDLVMENGRPLMEGVNFDTGPQYRSLQLFKALATTSDLMLTPSVWNTGAFTGQTQGSTELHLWCKPTKQYPMGLYARFLGEVTPRVVRLQGTDGAPVSFQLPYVNPQGTPLWPWVHYPFEKVSGRLYAQGVIDFIVQKQDQLNQTDSMIQLAYQRMGNPLWLEPKGSEVERFTGEPGLIVKYQMVGNQGAKPERIPGMDPPSSSFTLRQQYKDDAEELAGTFDVLKGAKPTGVEAYSALQLLVEQSQSRFATLFKMRAKAYQEWYTLALDLERGHGPSSRVRAVLGPNKAWTFQTFQKANLEGDVSVIIEDGTNTPKTALAKRASIEHARQLGVINPASNEQAYQVLAELGLLSMVPSLDSDVKSALEEQDAFETWAAQGFQGPCPLIRMPWQNDAVHFQENRKWMNGDTVRTILQQLQAAEPPPPPPVPLRPGQLPPPAPPTQYQNIVQTLTLHLQAHEIGMQAPLGTPPGMPPPGAPGAPQPGPGSVGPTPGQVPNPANHAPGGAGAAMANSNRNAGHGAGTSNPAMPPSPTIQPPAHT